jgi:hypothetical protein
MNIYQVMEECNLDQGYRSDQVVQYVAMGYTDDVWNRLIGEFLTGISNRHSVPGEVIGTLQGISHWHQEGKPLTLRQKMYTASNIMRYWSEIGLEFRSNLPI